MSLFVYIAPPLKDKSLPCGFAPQNLDWSNPADRETIAEQIRYARLRLASQSFLGTLEAPGTAVRKAERLSARLAVCDAARLLDFMPKDDRLPANHILALEHMADNIDTAAEVAATSPYHPMIDNFLIEARLCALLAWETRGRLGDKSGPFGGLRQLSWVVSRPSAKITRQALAGLDQAVNRARELPVNRGTADWRQAEVAAFFAAIGQVGRDCLPSRM